MSITEAQRKDRKNYIGSSDVAALFGMDPYGRNAHDVYLDKTGLLPDRQMTEPMGLGVLFEPAVLDYAEAGGAGTDWEGVGLIYRSPMAEFDGRLIAHCDAITQRDGIPVEVKVSPHAGNGQDWGDSGGAAVPDHVNIQLHAQMLCLVADSGWVVALLGRGLAHFYVPRDDIICNQIREVVEAFWETHVIPRVPPPDVLPSLDSLKVLRREPKKRVQLHPDFHAEWRLAKEALKRAKDEVDEKQKAILTALGDAEEGVFDQMAAELCLYDPEKMITYYEQSKRGVDDKKLFADRPELKAKYETKSTFRVLREKKV